MIQSELLTEISTNEVPRYLADPSYAAEEKHNGERRIICREGNRLRIYNREGEISQRGLPVHIINAILKHSLNSFIIDVEWVKAKNKIYILDVYTLGITHLIGLPYKQRKNEAHKVFDSQPYMEVVRAVTGQREKTELVLHLMKTKSEGVCFKKLDAPFRQGRSDQHKKFKFWKSLEAIVMGPNKEGHNSVEVGVYDNGVLRRICGVSLNGKPCVKIGNIVEIEYLYGTSTYEVVQPNLVRIRTDKRPLDCTINQIQMNKNFVRNA